MYQILYNYGNEGYGLEEELYSTVDEAVRDAIKTRVEFKIIKVIEWKAFGLRPEGELNSDFQVVTKQDKKVKAKVRK